MGRQSGSRRFGGWNSFGRFSAQPIIFTPNHFLNRSFAPERAATAVANGPAAKIDHISFAVLRLDQVGVTSSLKFHVWAIAGAEDVSVRMQFVRPSEIARARHRDSVSKA